MIDWLGGVCAWNLCKFTPPLVQEDRLSSLTVMHSQLIPGQAAGVDGLPTSCSDGKAKAKPLLGTSRFRRFIWKVHESAEYANMVKNVKSQDGVSLCSGFGFWMSAI